MKTERPIDLEALLGAWPESAPRPGFADRVLAACDRPSAPLALAPSPPGPRAASLLLWAALAAAMIVTPLLLLRHVPATNSPSVAAAADPDLGTQRD